MRVLLLLVSVLLVACTATADPDVRADDADPDEVEDRLREVAADRSGVEARLEAALTVVGEVDAVLETARTPVLAEEGLAAVETARDDLADLDPDDLRGALHGLAGTVDDARAELGRVLESSEGWRADYLLAQDEALSALREHAAACDALVQLIDRHRPAYEAALERLAEVEREWSGDTDPGDDPGGEDDARRKRDLTREIEAALSGRLESVALAQEELAAFAERAEATAAAVNEATADAATVFDRRPES